jgi:hypothetical protein
MKPARIGAVAALVLALALAATFAAEKPKGPKLPEVLVVSEALPDVPEGLRPAPGKPIYYLLGKAQLSLGEAVAGIKMPNPAEVEQTIVATLASQGFKRTEVGGPLPSILIVASWGDANFADFDFRDPNTDPDLQKALDKTSPRERDRRTVEHLVGTDKMLSLSPSDTTKVMAASNEDRLYISLAALDVPAWREKKKKLLWRTSMTIDARNKLADVMPVMLASAAPFFGRNADTPVFVDDNYRRKFEVNVGEVKVVPENGKSDAPTSGKK